MGNRVGWARIKSLINENQNQLKMLRPQVIAVSDTKTLKVSESGALISWTLGSTHHITLPAATVGLQYDFVIAKGADAAHTIISATDDKIHGSVFLMQAGSADQCNAQVVDHGSGVDKVHLIANGTARGGAAGTTIRLVCAEKGKWCATIHATTSGVPGGSVTMLAA